MDSPFILKDLVTCKECGENLETKNQTSSKSKTDASIYFCSKCKCKLKKDALNQIVIQYLLKWLTFIQSLRLFLHLIYQYCLKGNEFVGLLTYPRTSPCALASTRTVPKSHSPLIRIVNLSSFFNIEPKVISH